MAKSTHSRSKPAERAPVTLETPDVLAMLHTAFWLTDYLAACRNCALVALLACCYVLPGYAGNILLEDWRPMIDGQRRDVVFIRRHKEWQTVYLTPTVVFVVERYLAERARVAVQRGWTSEFLFVSVNGNRLQSGAIFEGVRSLVCLSKNQIRTYWWCSPPRIGRPRICPARSTARENGASFSNDRCVRAPL
jgi:site-specific recombinase XerD